MLISRSASIRHPSHKVHLQYTGTNTSETVRVLASHSK
ncbi:unnamed protein product [Musa hybrid cultivar]